MISSKKSRAKMGTYGILCSLSRLILISIRHDLEKTKSVDLDFFLLVSNLDFLDCSHTVNYFNLVRFSRPPDDTH